MSLTSAQTINTICVYCAASDQVDAKYIKLAHDFGRECAVRGFEIVYGGGSGGLMGALADGTLGQGGKVTGVIPEFLQEREVAHGGLSALHATETMQERQSKMAALSDAFVILPGGLGTLAEFFEVITWKQLGLQDKPIALINAYEFWTPLVGMLDHMNDQKFLHSRQDNLLSVFSDYNDVFAHWGAKKVG